MKFIIKKEQAGQRLDKFILTEETGYSRAYLKKQFKEGRILVNQEIKKPSYILKENDKIEAQILPPAQISLAPDASIKLNIVYEDKDVIVVDKPAGLTTHPAAGQKSGTLVNGLLAYYPLLADVGENPTRPGVVHRLDKGTSGLMIFAKNNSAFEWLKNQFQERKTAKKYIALVVGRPKETSGKIETFISRSKSDPTKQKVSQTGKKALTLYKTIKEFKDYTLIEATPKTGRMHQIRVHLAWLGCPVAGDKKYGRKNQAAPPGLERHFLHASQLTISLPSREIKEFLSPLPPDLNQILADLET